METLKFLVGLAAFVASLKPMAVLLAEVRLIILVLLIALVRDERKLEMLKRLLNIARKQSLNESSHDSSRVLVKTARPARRS